MTKMIETIKHLTGVVFSCGGKTVIDMALANLPESIVMQAAVHGLTQKIADAAAGKKTIADKLAAMRQVADQIRSGNWNAPRGTGERDAGLTIAALMEMFPAKTESDVRAWWAPKNADQRAAIKNTVRFINALATVKTRRAADAPAADDLFAELDD